MPEYSYCGLSTGITSKAFDDNDPVCVDFLIAGIMLFFTIQKIKKMPHPKCIVHIFMCKTETEDNAFNFLVALTYT